MQTIKLIYIFSFFVLFNLACSDQSASSTNSDQITDISVADSINSYPPLHDTSFSVKKTFMVDAKTPALNIFRKLGAVKVKYRNERIDWCARFKKYALYDENNKHIITFGIEGYNLFASKYEFDSFKEFQECYKVFNKSYNNYENVECFYESDSLLIQALTPLVDKNWIGEN